jgi:hypothetical protein
MCYDCSRLNDASCGRLNDPESDSKAPGAGHGGNTHTWAVTDEINRLKALYPDEIIPEAELKAVLDKLKTQGIVLSYNQFKPGHWEVLCPNSYTVNIILNT